jgi:peptide subunit release factor 1 (eRF1)
MKLNELLSKLIALESGGFPVLSLYVSTEANARGRDDFNVWLSAKLSDLNQRYEPESPELESVRRDVERITNFVENEVEPSAQGLAIFACFGAEEFFETAQLEIPFPNNNLFTFERAHIFPLYRAIEQNPRYLALWADTSKAEIYIFGGERMIDAKAQTKAQIEEIENVLTLDAPEGIRSEYNLHRRTENFHLQHARETVDEVEKLMRDTKIEYLILCGNDTTIMPVLRPQLPKALEEKVVGTLNLSQYASEEEIHQATHELMRKHDEEQDEEQFNRVVGAAKAAAGLGVLGVKDTLSALSNGQVEELIISASFDAIKYRKKDVEEVLEAYAPGDDNSVTDDLPEADEPRQIADELIIRALNSAAKICFIEDSDRIKEIGGVGAVLRYNINATANG